MIIQVYKCASVMYMDALYRMCQIHRNYSAVKTRVYFTARYPIVWISTAAMTNELPNGQKLSTGQVG